MGRIKQSALKRLANKLLAEYGKEFDTDFGKNKEMVQKFSIIGSKPIRNKIAGYISRVMRQRAKSAELGQV